MFHCMYCNVCSLCIVMCTLFVYSLCVWHILIKNYLLTYLLTYYMETCDSRALPGHVWTAFKDVSVSSQCYWRVAGCGRCSVSWWAAWLSSYVDDVVIFTTLNCPLLLSGSATSTVSWLDDDGSSCLSSVLHRSSSSTCLPAKLSGLTSPTSTTCGPRCLPASTSHTRTLAVKSAIR